ncbi:MAG: replication-associated recombination protein A [Chloroflexi bacterium]|nr:replication-associated recombination protein A [Chloroflexota bacterium]
MPVPRGRKTREADLFEAQRQKLLAQEAPLAARMRPRTFPEFVGQEHLVGEDRVLRRAIEGDQLPSVILWGPPGTGKTTLAQIIAHTTRSHFSPVSAVTAGVADLRRIIEEATQRRALYGQRTILFIDEIHRFNKAQQDVVLPHVEEGTVTLIGATTENPSFEVIAPLLSRCRVFTLNLLTGPQVDAIIQRALEDTERGLGGLGVELDAQARKHLIVMCNGDARVALNALELAAFATPPDLQGKRLITLATIEDALQHRAIMYDKGGEQHYDIISAYIKSVRGSDPHAAIYWLARMLEGGEDPLFIARRMVILAAEDVGLGDPQALVVAVAAQQAVHFIGMPEGYLPLAEATIYLATAPKSNSALTAYGRALEDVKNTRNDPVPFHLRNAPTSLMRALGYHEGYKYAHAYPGHHVEQQYLPHPLQGKTYYVPGDQGFERQVAERLQRWYEEGKSSSPRKSDPDQ